VTRMAGSENNGGNPSGMRKVHCLDIGGPIFPLTIAKLTGLLDSNQQTHEHKVSTLSDANGGENEMRLWVDSTASANLNLNSDFKVPPQLTQRVTQCSSIAHEPEVKSTIQQVARARNVTIAMDSIKVSGGAFLVSLGTS